jgi:cbb3-type cytochrome oxidase subunit 3
MKKEVLSNFTLTYLPTIGLFLFLICFVIIVYYTLKPSNKKFYNQASHLPLEDNQKES